MVRGSPEHHRSSEALSLSRPNFKLERNCKSRTKPGDGEALDARPVHQRTASAHTSKSCQEIRSLESPESTRARERERERERTFCARARARPSLERTPSISRLDSLRIHRSGILETENVANVREQQDARRMLKRSFRFPVADSRRIDRSRSRSSFYAGSPAHSLSESPKPRHPVSRPFSQNTHGSTNRASQRVRRRRSRSGERAGERRDIDLDVRLNLKESVSDDISRGSLFVPRKGNKERILRVWLFLRTPIDRPQIVCRRRLIFRVL